ncbi:MAG: hypothetical protein IIZ40_01665 [Bacilli bacterium]|nr:hypothetical protein [Bacilli bacterium]
MKVIKKDVFDIKISDNEGLGFDNTYLLQNFSYLVGCYNRSFGEKPNVEWRLSKQDVNTTSGNFVYNIKGYIEINTGYYELISVQDKNGVFRKIILHNNKVIDDYKSIIDKNTHREIIISRENIANIPLKPSDKKYDIEEYIKLHNDKDNEKVEKFLEKNKELQIKYIKSLKLK